MTLPSLYLLESFVNLANLPAGIVAIFDWHVEVQDDCTEVSWLLENPPRIKLMELGHVLLDYLDGLVTILRLHNLRPRMLLKHHLHRRKNKRLVIDQQYLIARAILKIIILIVLIAVFDYLIRLPQALR